MKVIEAIYDITHQENFARLRANNTTLYDYPTFEEASNEVCNIIQDNWRYFD